MFDFLSDSFQLFLNVADIPETVVVIRPSVFVCLQVFSVWADVPSDVWKDAVFEYQVADGKDVEVVLLLCLLSLIHI